MFVVYILKSDKNGRHYYGHTKNLDNRLKLHNSGRVRSTKAYKPWKVIYTETYATKSSAYKREMFFKSIEGYKYLNSKDII